MAGNPYLEWVETFVKALRTGEAISQPTVRGPSPVATEAPKALIFAPHPDDEVITGALPLRLMREQRFAVIDVAVTLGSRVDRRAQRSMELQAACASIGFGLVHLGRAGLEGINLEARERDRRRPTWRIWWRRCRCTRAKSRETLITCACRPG
jgi:hypothetical protein